LLLNAGKMVPLSLLVDALWDTCPPGTARKQARNAVSRLRCRLTAAGTSQPIRTDDGGYRLVVGTGGLDAQRFERLVAEAAYAESMGFAAQAAALLRSALALWRGPALVGLRGQVIENAAAAWNERRRTVREAYYDAELALGRHCELVSELTSLVRDEPLSERPAAQLMLALYRCGRPADALALYSSTRRLLADELGLDPGQHLQTLHQRILSGDAALTGPQRPAAMRPAP
jgi:DNA-binding SARP family transcriptional activator